MQMYYCSKKWYGKMTKNLFPSTAFILITKMYAYAQLTNSKAFPISYEITNGSCLQKTWTAISSFSSQQISMGQKFIITAVKCFYLQCLVKSRNLIYVVFLCKTSLIAKIIHIKFLNWKYYSFSEPVLLNSDLYP